jgi:hypothetical protein
LNHRPTQTASRPSLEALPVLDERPSSVQAKSQ